MNKIFRNIWCDATQTWVAVAEIARTQGGPASSAAASHLQADGAAAASPWDIAAIRPLSLALALGLGQAAFAAPPIPPVAGQLPTGGQVAAGAAQISAAAGNTLNINQSSQRAVVNWQTFDVGSAATVNFNQPNASAVTLNRVLSSDPSQIYGRVNATGQVFLSNPSGIYFAPGASANVGSLVATTHSIADADFMVGGNTLNLTRNGATGVVQNDGTLTASLGGYIALLAPEVRNQGVIVAPMGTVALAAGEAYQLQFQGPALAGVTVSQSALQALVDNGNAIQAPGGQVILSARGMNALQGSVVNSGSIEASSLTNKGGSIVLEGDAITLKSGSSLKADGATGGGTVLVGGDWQGSGAMHQATTVTMEQGASISASATSQGDGGKVVLWSDVHKDGGLTTANGSVSAQGLGAASQGGQVETSGHSVEIDGFSVNTLAQGGGKTGLWLIDPYDYTIGAAQATTINTALLTSSVTVDTSVDTPAYGSNGAVGSAGDITLSVGANISTILGSNLTFNAARNIVLNGNISMGTGTLALNAAAGNVSGSGNIASSGSTIFNPGGATEGILAGTISGLQSITKNGTGLTGLTGTVSYTGATTVNAGQLRVMPPAFGNGGIYALSTSGTTINNGGTYKLDFSRSSSVPFGTPGVKYNLKTIQVNTGGVLELYSTAISVDAMAGDVGTVIQGTGTVKKTGAGYFTLNRYAGTNAFNSFQGQLWIEDGIWTMNNGNQGNTSLSTFVDTNGVLDIRTGSFTTNTLTGTGRIARSFNGGAGSLIVGGNGGSSQFDGVIGQTTFTGGGITSSGSIALVKNGAGTFTLTGNNTYTGSTTINGGTVQVGNNTATGTLGTGAIVDNGALVFQRSAPLTVTQVISGTGSLTQDGTGTVILAANNTYSGATTINTGGTLQVGNGGATGSLGNTSAISDNGALVFNTTGNQTIAAVISGTGSLTKSNTGTLTLTGNNTYGGATTINAGTLQVGNGGASGALSGTSSITDNGSLVFNTSGTPTIAAVISGTGSLTKSGTGTLTLTGNNTYTGATTINAGTLQVGNGGASGALSNTSSITDNGSLVFNTSGVSTIAAAIGGTGRLTQNGTGTVILTGNNAYSGTTNVNAGTLQVGNGGTTGKLGGGAVTTDANLVFMRSDDVALGALGVSGGSVITGTGNVTAESSGGNIFVDRGITLSGAGSTITLKAGTSKPAGDSTGGFVNLTLPMTTSGTGTTIIFSGTSPQTTATLETRISGATGTTRYETYNAGAAATAGAVAGTRNYFYRAAPTVDVSLTASKTYDGTTSATGATWGGTITSYNGDSGDIPRGLTAASLTRTSSSYADARVVNNIGGAGALNVAFDGTANFVNGGTNWHLAGLTINRTATGGTITPKALTVAGTTVDSKVYDGNTTALVSGGSLQGMVAGDNVTLTQAGTFATKNVGNGIVVTAADSLGGGDSGNYTLTQPTGLSANITPRALTISGIAAADKTYDGTNAATVSTAGASFSGLVGADDVTVSATGTFSDKNVGVGKTVSLTSSNGGADAGNYTITNQSSTTASITPKSVTVTGLAADDKVYDATTSVVINNWGSVATGIAGETLTLNHGSAAFSDANASVTAKTVTANGYVLANGTGAASNYQLTSTSATTTAMIGTAPLTVTANNDAKLVTQADTPNYNGVSYSGFKGSDNASNSIGGTLAIARSGMGTQESAGIYAAVLEASGLSSGNYTITYAKGDYTIVPAQQLLIKTGNTTSTYGAGASYAPTAQYLDVDNVTIHVLPVTSLGGNAFSVTDGAGTTASFTLRPQGGATSGSGNTVVGNYQVADAAPVRTGNNFNSFYFTGNESVLAKGVTVNSGAVTKVYDGTNSLSNLNLGLTGIVAGDTVTISGDGAFNQRNAGVNLGYSVQNLALGASDAGNYFLSGGSSLNSSNGTITPKTLTVSGITAADKIYDGTTAATVNTAGSVFSGLVTGDILLVSATGAFSDASIGNAKPVTLTSSYAGADAGNYAIIDQASTTASITPAIAAPLPSAVPSLDLAALAGAASSDILRDRSANSAETSDVVVNLITLPSQDADGAVAVFVPRDMETTGVGFSFVLPPELLSLIDPGDEVNLTAANGVPLPSGLRYVPETRRLVIAPVPGSTFPSAAILTTSKMRTVIMITRRA